jgi:hypothetical protein
MRHARSRTLPVAIVALGLLTTGCFNPFNPQVADPNLTRTTSASNSAPVPSSPSQLLRLFAWCWNNRSYNEYTEIFTNDFQFQFGLADSAGNAYRDHGLYRNEELDTAKHLFIEGTATEPPARLINLVLGGTFPVADSRPGKMSPWHKEVKTNVVLTIETGDQAFQVTGSARFFLVRGDSATIPQDMIDKGFKPNRFRWYIERWEDETQTSAGLIANRGVGLMLLKGALAEGQNAPTSTEAATLVPAAGTGALTTGVSDVSWGYVKRRYLFGPTVAAR